MLSGRLKYWGGKSRGGLGYEGEARERESLGLGGT